MASILFVVGIPLIPVFAGKNWAIAIMGIIFTVFGFYGMPLLWIKYGTLHGMKRLVIAIIEDNLLTVSELSMQLQLDEREVRNRITKALSKRYITGFVFDGQKLSLNENKKPAYKVEVRTCDNCAARLEITDTEVYCPYCGTIYTKIIHNKNKQ
ncbi:MAG: hypothetical protein IKC11_02435 [Clostridia bacterium]|nr:hypothetical protein [Clostridia bacterium]